MADAINGNRRNLLKSLGALPFMTMSLGKDKPSVEAVDVGDRFLIFFDARIIDGAALDALCSSEELALPQLAGSLWIPVRLQPDQRIEDAIAIYDTKGDTRADVLDLSKWGARDFPPTLDKTPKP